MKTNQTENKEVQNIVPAKTIKKLTELFKKEEITRADINTFSADELAEFNNMLSQKMDESTPEEKDKLLKKIDPILTQQKKEDLWDANHKSILQFIHSYLSDFGSFPTKSVIARKTNLSRPCIDRHFKEFENHPIVSQQEEHYKLMKGNILGIIYRSAAQGNTNAAKLFLEQTGLARAVPAKNQQYIQNQHNYIQINGVKLSQEQIQKLDPEKLTQIEEILKKTLPAPNPEAEKAA